MSADWKTVYTMPIFKDCTIFIWNKTLTSEANIFKVHEILDFCVHSSQDYVLLFKIQHPHELRVSEKFPFKRFTFRHIFPCLSILTADNIRGNESGHHSRISLGALQTDVDLSVILTLRFAPVATFLILHKYIDYESSNTFTEIKLDYNIFKLQTNLIILNNLENKSYFLNTLGNSLPIDDQLCELLYPTIICHHKFYKFGIAALIEFENSMEVNNLLQLSKKINQNWSKNIPSPNFEIEANQPCDKLKVLSNDVFGYGHTEADICISDLIRLHHNCSEEICRVFAEEGVSMFDISKDVTPYTYASFGAKFKEYNIMLLKSSLSNVANILGLLKPIEFKWWAIVLISGLSFSLTLKLLGINTAYFEIVKMILEQDFNISPKLLSGKVKGIVTLWLYTCIMLRAVYTSSFYTFITAKQLPNAPSSVEDVIKNWSPFVVVDESMKLILTKHTEDILSIEENATFHYPKFVNSGVNSRLCFVSDLIWIDLWDSRGKQLHCSKSYSKFYSSLSSGRESSCSLKIMDIKTEDIVRNPMQNPDNFIAIYSNLSPFMYSMQMLGKRLAFQGQGNNLMVTMTGFGSLFRKHVLLQFFDEDLRYLEASGIILKIRNDYASLEELRVLQNGIKLMGLRKSGNLFAVVDKSMALNEELLAEDDFTPANLSSILVILVLYTILLVVCITIFSVENLVSKLQKN
ncbi:unnamed protein product [Orchesella dallaii]|uniref:Uncharacterized protein n=1 Tax=Orchesella dallaii TaxID=48710 RepID=A0ABP1QCU5_9HEXA